MGYVFWFFSCRTFPINLRVCGGWRFGYGVIFGFVSVYSATNLWFLRLVLGCVFGMIVLYFD